MEFYIDEVRADHVTGWAVSSKGVKSILISVDNTLVGTARMGIARPDLGAAFPEIDGSDHSGFLYVFRREQFHRPVSSISIEMIENDGGREVVRYDRIPTVFIDRDDQTETHSDTGAALSPFPLDIQRLLVTFAPDLYARPERWSADLVRNAVDHLIWLVKSGSRTLHPLNRYIFFLKSLKARYELIAALFPRFNASAGADAKDIASVLSSPNEMLCISHHLKVLTSYGLHGPLAEFGCFKGFSSTCLSHACHELGMQLHVFDSFAGLPPSASAYYQSGDFAGSFDEVSHNIRTLGKIEDVRLFRGFFSSTVPNYREDPVAIWMDVDLASSAQDVMQLLPRLSTQSIVFTHECQPENFVAGEVVPHSGPDAVLPPILAAFRSRGCQPVGAFLCGDTGAIWDRDRGLPPLGIEAIAALCDAV